MICLVCGVTLDIDTRSHNIFNIPPYRSLKEREVIEEHINDMLRKKIVISGYLTLQLHFKGLWI